MVKVNDEVKNKLKAAQSAIEQIKSKFGEGAIMTYGEGHTMQVEAVSTGCLSLDVALGVSLKSMVQDLLVKPPYPNM